jgi:hypothetical protein
MSLDTYLRHLLEQRTLPNLPSSSQPDGQWSQHVAQRIGVVRERAQTERARTTERPLSASAPAASNGHAAPASPPAIPTAERGRGG